MQQKTRCAWAGEDPDYIRYHDLEWGIALHDDKILFEMLVLEGFQAGLSWITVLKRRDHFRKAFAGFDWEKVAAFDEKKIKELLLDKGIIRNRLKITSAINNASKFMDVRKEFGTFDKYIWQFTGYSTIYPSIPPRVWKDLPVRTPESDAMSKDLKKRGFTFVGSVICYAYMQAIGMANDHLEGCFKFYSCK